MTNPRTSGPIWNYASFDRQDHLILATHVQHKHPLVEAFVTEQGNQQVELSLETPSAVQSTAMALYDRLKKGPGSIMLGSEHEDWLYCLEDQVRHDRQQTLHTPRQFLGDGTHPGDPKGTCIDYVLLLAAILLQARIRPLIIITSKHNKKTKQEESHAVLGYWTKNDVELESPGVCNGSEFREQLSDLSENSTKVLFGVLDAAFIAPYRIRTGDKETREVLEATEAEAKALESLPHNIAEFCISSDQGGSDNATIFTVVDVVPAMNAWNHRASQFGHPFPLPEHFQNRAENRQVEEWYLAQWGRENSPQVVSLVGPRGSGKSTIGSHLVQSIRHGNLEQPDWSFVWRFNENSSVEHCLSALQSSLKAMAGASSDHRSGIFFDIRELLRHLEAEQGLRHGLLILDGLEELQTSGGGRLKAEAVELKWLLSWCCETAASIRVLITSTLEIDDLLSFRGTSYKSIDVGDLDGATATSLLRAHALTGSDDNFATVIDTFGTNPLTVSALGTAVKELCEGAVRSALDWPVAGEVPFDSGTGQEEQLRRVLSFHERNLSPLSLDIMRLLSLLSSVPISLDVVKEVYCRVKRSEYIDRRRAEKALTELARHSLVVAHDDDEHLLTYTAHKSYKHYFSTSNNFHNRTTSRRAIIGYLKRVSCQRLSDRPSVEETSQLLELVHQLAALGKQRAANRVYRRRMSVRGAFVKKEGPYDRLSNLNLLSLGLRTIETTLAGTTEGTCAHDRLLPWQMARLLNDKGGFERDLGALHDSEQSYQMAKDVVEQAPQYWRYVPVARGNLELNRSFALRNPARTFIFRGLLKEGLEAAKQSWEHERKVGDREGQQISLCLQARALGLCGEVKEAGKLYEKALGVGRGKLRRRFFARRFFTKGYGLRWGHLVMRAKGTEAANDLIIEAQSWTNEEGLGDDNLGKLMLRLLETNLKDLPNEEWENELTAIRDSAQQTSRRELEAWSQTMLARFALESGNTSLCRRLTDAGLELCERYGYALHWIDLQVTRGCLDLFEASDDSTDSSDACEYVHSAYKAARLALYGLPLRDENDATKDSRAIPVEELSIIGAANVACKYRWGEMDALRLLVGIHKYMKTPLDEIILEGKNLEYFDKREQSLRGELQPNPAQVPQTLR